MAHGSRLVMPAVMAAGAVALVVRRRKGWWAAGVALFVLQPVAVAVGGLAWALVQLRRRLRRRRTHHDAAVDDVATLAELVGLGLSAGLTLRQALAAASEYVHPLVRSEVEDLLHRAVHRGLATVLADTGGYGRRLYLVSARAAVTGAPLGAAVDAFAGELTAEQHAQDLAKAHRLPVRMMVPLALFILPGFVLLTVGPAVLAALDRVVLPS